MSNIEDLDVNFKVGSTIEKEGLRFYNALEKPMKIYGIYKEDGKFRRMPEKVAASVSSGVLGLHARTAGGRVRFRTDSANVAISAAMGTASKMPHFAYTGSVGFDLYADNRYIKTFVPTIGISTGDVFESLRPLYTPEERKMREVEINFPLYSEVRDLYIGLDEDAVVEEATPYRIEKPVVYYGASITQGGCASRPGTCYQAIISRRFSCDYINLGFSGNARGEQAMADYLKTLDMSVYVCDYAQALSPEHLAETHEPMFLAIREAHPDLPIILMTRPQFYQDKNETKRWSVIETTYKNALAAGDKNVYFLNGTALMALCGNEGTVDGSHPTDFGFASMAAALGDLIEKYHLL